MDVFVCECCCVHVYVVLFKHEFVPNTNLYKCVALYILMLFCVCVCVCVCVCSCVRAFIVFYKHVFVQIFCFVHIYTHMCL